MILRLDLSLDLRLDLSLDLSLDLDLSLVRKRTLPILVHQNILLFDCILSFPNISL